MNWFLHIDNKQAISSLFSENDNLNIVEIQLVKIFDEGRALKLRFDVPFVPDQLPKRWTIDSNTTQITISAWGVTNIEICSRENWTKGRLLVDDSGLIKKLIFIENSCQIKCDFQCLFVTKISGYVNEI